MSFLFGSPEDHFRYQPSYKRPGGLAGVGDYVRRTISRSLGFQQQHNLHERMIATGTDNWPVISGARRFGSWGSSMLFPLSQGLKQTEIADIPVLGGLARTAAIIPDLGSLPFRVNPVGWLLYHGLTAAAIEGVATFAPSKNTPVSVDKTTRR